MIEKFWRHLVCRSRRVFVGGLLGTLIVMNPFSVGRMMAACNVKPTVGSTIGGVSSVKLSYGSTGNNCTGTLIFSPVPSTSPNGTQGANYVLGQTYAGAVVVENNAAGTAGTVSLENGPNQVVVPGTSVTYALYFYKVTDFGDVLSVTGTAIPGGGTTNPNWTYLTGATSLAAPSLSAGGEVVASGNDGKLHSMEPSYGVRQYQPGTSAGAAGLIGSPVQGRFPVIPGAYLASATQQLAGCGTSNCDVAYVGAGNGRVYAFNAKTGAQLWQSDVLGASIQGAPAVQLKMFSSNVPWNNDLVIVGTRSASSIGNTIWALDGSTGKEVWHLSPGNLDIVTSTPALDYANNRVWVTSWAGSGGAQPSIWAIDTTNGNQWAAITLTGLPTTARNIGSSPTLNFSSAHPYLYVVTDSGALLAVNATTKAVDQIVSVGGTGVTRPLVVHSTTDLSDDVYFSTSTSVNKQTFTFAGTSFAQGWRITSRFSNGDTLSGPSAPMVNGFPIPSAVYVGAKNGKLYSLDPATGNVRTGGTRVVDTNTTTTVGDPSYDGSLNNIYVGADNGRIYSYGSF